MIIQFEILQAQGDRIIAALPSLGFVYDPESTISEEQQKWAFFVNMTLSHWDGLVFNYERSLAIANEPNDSAALQAERYEVVKDEILHDNEKDWLAGETIKIGMIRWYGPNRYIAIQDHVTQDGWEPPNVPALFIVKNPPDQGQQYPNWVQPTGGHDAYNTGDRVRHNDLNWESTIDANVWEPGVYGWITIT